jgi:hypothetical protein
MRRTRAQNQLPSTIDFLALPLLVKQLVVATLPLRDQLVFEQVSKHCRSLVDWRAWSNRALALVDSIDLPDDGDSDPLAVFDTRFEIGNQSTHPAWVNRSECDVHTTNMATSFDSTQRLKDAVSELSSRGAFKLVAMLAFRFAACIVCEQSCDRFWFGHRLHEACEAKDRAKFRLMPLREAFSHAKTEHPSSVLDVMEQEGVRWIFKMSTGSTSKLSTVWKRQFSTDLTRLAESMSSRSSVAATSVAKKKRKS